MQHEKHTWEAAVGMYACVRVWVCAWELHAVKHPFESVHSGGEHPPLYPDGHGGGGAGGGGTRHSTGAGAVVGFLVVMSALGGLFLSRHAIFERFPQVSWHWIPN